MASVSKTSFPDMSAPPIYGVSSNMDDTSFPDIVPHPYIKYLVTWMKELAGKSER